MSTEVATLLQKSVETISALQTYIKSIQPAAELGLAVMDDGECYGFAEAAKLLSPKLKEATGSEIGRNRLIDTLKALGILMPNCEPYQQYMNHFKVVLKQTPVGMKTTSLITGKGLAWLLPKLVEYYR